MGGFVKEYGMHDDCPGCPEGDYDNCKCEELWLERAISSADAMLDNLGE